MSALSNAGSQRHRFFLPDGIIYLDGNSLGPLPKTVPSQTDDMLRNQWGQMLIGGWNKAGWMAQPGLIGDRIAKLIGAERNSVVVGDTLSIKVFQALSAALALRPDRKIVLSDQGNFPTDLYMAEGLLRAGQGAQTLKLTEPEDVAASIDEDVAVVMLTHVDYRTGRMHDMAATTAMAHEKGALVIWDLAHSAGALEVDLSAVNADFAAGCSYKYLNGGPGAPAFVYVSPRWQEKIEPLLSGWLGHAAPFAFELGYRPAPGIDRMRVGTPPVIQMAALDSALDVFDAVSMADLRAQSLALSSLFIKLVQEQCPSLQLRSPVDENKRGSHVSFGHMDGYAMMQALIARGVIGDFRAPDMMRFGFAPLYNNEADIVSAVNILAEIMRTDAWCDPAYAVRSAVT